MGISNRIIRKLRGGIQEEGGETRLWKTAPTLFFEIRRNMYFLPTPSREFESAMARGTKCEEQKATMMLIFDRASLTLRVDVGRGLAELLNAETTPLRSDFQGSESRELRKKLRIDNTGLLGALSFPSDPSPNMKITVLSSLHRPVEQLGSKPG